MKILRLAKRGDTETLCRLFESDVATFVTLLVVVLVVVLLVGLFNRYKNA